MKLLEKKKSEKGRTRVYFCGVKIFSYKRKRTPRPLSSYLGIDPYDVLLISATPPTDGVCIWRMQFLKEMLEKKGFRVQLIYEFDALNKIHAYVIKCQSIIYSRALDSDVSRSIFGYAKQYAKPLILDLDDLTLSTGSHMSGNVKSGVSKRSDVYSKGLTYEKALVFADHISVSTPFLKSAFQQLFTQRISIYQNSISTELVASSERHSPMGDTLNILYASGSSTHDFDFSTIYLDLVNFLSSHDDVTLTILGASSWKMGFDFLGDRLRILPRVGFEEMLNAFGEYDLLLVPLDKNDFNHGKSNIKYIEAGARGTPVLATDVDEYRSTIRHGENGYLFDEESFYHVLEEIYLHRASLRQIGENARRDVLRFHTVDRAETELLDLLNRACGKTDSSGTK